MGSRRGAMDTTIAVTLDDPAAAYEGLTRLGERDVQRRLRSAGQLLVPDEIHGPGPAGSKALIGGGAGPLPGIFRRPVRRGARRHGRRAPRPVTAGRAERSARRMRHVPAGITALPAALDEGA